jgi:hypothetical protein
VTVSWLHRQTRAEAMGRCVRCGDELTAEGCPGCAEVANVKQDERRDQHAAEGRCRCGRVRAEGRQQCPPCLAADREYKRLAPVRGVEQGLMDTRRNQGERQ